MAAPRPPVQKFRVVADVKSHVRDHLKREVFYARAGDVVTAVRDEPHNNMVTVDNGGSRFGTLRTNLIPISSKPPF